MSTTIESDQEITEEAFEILAQHLPPHKLARLLSIWQIGKGDYVQDRELIFAGQTVDSIYEAVAPPKR